jgi:hypothetical protein
VFIHLRAKVVENHPLSPYLAMPSRRIFSWCNHRLQQRIANMGTFIVGFALGLVAGACALIVLAAIQQA